jgi:hypothetical protein
MRSVAPISTVDDDFRRGYRDGSLPMCVGVERYAESFRNLSYDL